MKVGAAFDRQPGADHRPVRRPEAAKSPEPEKFAACLRSPDAAPLVAALKRRSAPPDERFRSGSRLRRGARPDH